VRRSSTLTALFAALVAFALVAAACGDDTEDGADTEVDRIGSRSASATEILFAIGAGDQVVAVDQFSDHPEEAPTTDLDGFTPNVEAIADYEPDLVTMQSNEAAAELEALGITVIQRDAPADLDGIHAQIEELGAATGHIGEAAELVLQMQTDMDTLLADVPDASGLTYYHELGTDYFSLTADTFIGAIYAEFGLTSIGDAAEGDVFDGYLQLTEEYILGADPDLVFLADTAMGESAETVAARPGWENLRAVTGDAVIELDDDTASRWGPRVIEFATDVSDALQVVAVPA